MTEIALAAGFGSMRRFNETFPTPVRRPPTRAAARSRRATYRPARTAKSSAAAALPAALRLAGDARVPARAARSPASRASRATLYREPSASTACTGTVAVRAGRRAMRCGRVSAFPSFRPCRKSSPACAACSTWPPTPMPIAAPTRQGSGAGAAGRRAPGPARARRLGRVRAGDARGARSTDHRSAAIGLAGRLVARFGEKLTEPRRRS